MLSTGEKIRQIRKAKGFSQENLAHDIGLSTSTVCRIEQGTTAINSDILKAIKKALDIGSAPLLPGEGEGFRERLQVWHKLILDGHLIEARTLQKSLSEITQLPFEYGLITLYWLFEVSLLLAAQDYEGADTRLKSMKSSLDDMCDTNMYYYFRNMGWLYMSIGPDKAKKPLDYLLKAKAIAKKPDGGLYYRIARCYTRLGQPFKSMEMIDKAYAAYGENKTTSTSLDLDNKMALNCIDIGDTTRARGILEKCLIMAKNISSDMYVAIILHNIGSTYTRDKEWETALEFFTQAESYFNITERTMLINYYYKARCLVALRRFAQCKEILSLVAEHIINSEYYTVLFSSINHLITIKEPASHRYLDAVTIPFLVRYNNIVDTLDYTEILENFHSGKGSTKKALEFAKIQRDIYGGMIKMT